MIKPLGSSADTTVLGTTLRKTEALTLEVQRASDDLAIVHTVLEHELPSEIQVGEVAQALQHTGQLEEKLAQSAGELIEVNAVLAEEIEKRKNAEAQLARKSSGFSAASSQGE